MTTGRLSQEATMSRILVVDDEEKTVMLIRKILEAHSHKVTAAYSGRQGLSRAVRTMPHLIVADIMMPDMDGLEMLRKIKDETGRTWMIPVIMLTGVEPEKAMREAMYSYAECYLVKPVNEAALMDVVTRVLSVKRPGRGWRAYLAAVEGWIRHLFGAD